MFSTLFNNLTYILKIFHIFVEMLLKSSASELLYVERVKSYTSEKVEMLRYIILIYSLEQRSGSGQYCLEIPLHNLTESV